MNKFNFKNILPAFLVLLVILIFGPVAFSQEWSEIQPEYNFWQASALSSDGVIILAAHGSGSGQRSGLLKRSTNGGASWVNAGPTPDQNKNWYSLAMSANGQYMMAGEYQGRIYRSTDGGTTWTETRPAGDLNGIWGIAMSDNGQTVLAANWDRRLYKSSDFGTTWAELQPAGDNNRGWSVAAVSGDGNTFVAGIWGTKNIYVSHDAGSSWSSPPNLLNDALWQSADLSYDGQIAYISTTNSLLGPLKSTDGLANWSEMSVGNTSASHRGISCSSDGRTLAIVIQDEQKIYYSINGGSSWSNHSIPPYPTAYFQGTTVSVSQDGSTILGLTADYMQGGYYWEPDIPYGRIYKGVLPVNIPPALGVGTIADPYQIATLANLNWLSTTTSVWGSKYFIQTADIDAVATKFQNPDGVGGYAGFSPIGQLNDISFHGTYDGNGKTISNLYINRTVGLYTGLFSTAEGTIKNLGVLNADVTGGTYAGILAGQNQNQASIHNCYSSGSVKGASAGGLVGLNGGSTVELCYSTASVQTTADGESNSAGGLIAKLSSSQVLNCYAHGSVSGTTGNCIGGLIGSTQFNVTVNKCYAKGEVTLVGTSGYAGGLFGNAIWWDQSPYSINDCYWDTETSGQAASSGGTGVVGKTTAGMKTKSTYPNWNFSYPWNMIPGNYPVLYILGPTYSGGNGTLASPYQIANINDLLVMDVFPAHWNKYFIQTANIDAAGSALLPIGNSDNNFTGSYDGQNFTIDHFAYDGLATNDMKVGFFKNVSGASLKNIKLTHLNLSAIAIIGGLAGIAGNTTVDNCFVSGNLTSLLIGGGLVGVSGNSTFSRCGADVVFTGNLLYGPAANTHLGGFAGLVEGSSTFTNCYARGSVSGFKIGGFVGGLDMNSTPFNQTPSIDPAMGFTLTNCYAANTLTVSDGGEKGGLYGQSTYTGTSIIMTNSYWDNDLAATANGYIGGTAKTTSEMKTQGTFTGWNFSTPIWSLNSAYNSGYPYLEGQIDPDISWTGASSTNWNTAGNWSANTVPAVNEDIIIPDVVNDPVVAAGIGANCRNLTVNSGATLTIESGGSLITNGTITNNGTFNLKRTASDGQYHLVSSPITNATANTFLGEYLQTWDETTAAWSNISNPAASLIVAKGYSLWGIAKGNQTYTFMGTPNTGNQSLAITAQGTGGSYNGANLVGNPYPSAINWDNLNETYGAVYYWNGSAYLSWNNDAGGGTQYVPPMQGFFIVTAANGNFNLTNSSRTHTGAGSIYKSGNEKTIENGLILQASNGSYNDELYLLFNDEASPDFEMVRDAWKLQSSTAGISQIWSVCSDGNLSIDVRPDQETIQLGFANGQTGFYSISLNEMAGISKATLEDTKLNIFHNLQNGKYDFAWDKNDIETRFKLHLNTVGIEETPATAGILWIAGNTLYIAAPKLSGQTGLVEVYNASGQKLMSKTIILSELSTLEINCKGFVMARLTAGNEVMTTKGIILN